MPNFQRRLAKYYHIVSRYPKELARIVSKNSDIDHHHRPSILYGMISTPSKLHDTQQIDVRDKSFAVEVTNAYIGFKELAGHQENVREVLGDDFETVWHYLEKATALQGAIMDLDRLARSRRRSPVLKKQLKVVDLAHGPGNTMPINSNDWSAIVADTLTKYDETAEQTKGLSDAVEKAKAVHGGRKSTTHCEMKIFQHLVSQLAPGDTPPIRYIGVSKLVCMGCWAVVNAWNEFAPDPDRPKYVLRGSHGKWYFPWAVPALASAEDPVMDHICRSITQMVMQGLKEKEVFHVKDNSSVTSGELPWAFSTSCKDEWDANLLEEAEEYRKL